MEKAGWYLHDLSRVKIEITACPDALFGVDGYDAEPWNGISDYCLARLSSLRSRSIVVTPTKAEAEEIGRQVGKNSKVDVITQRKDGTIQSHDSFGNDPYPPQDKEH